MPALTDTNVVRTKGPLTKPELTRALRLAIIAEHDAVQLYEAQAEACDDDLVKRVLLDIAREERVHVGELTALLQYLTGDEDKTMQEGFDEVKKLTGEEA